MERRSGALVPNDVRADLIADLTYLRKGAGLTGDRLRQAGAVVAACGGADLPTETLLERLVGAVRSIGRTDGGRALIAALGLDGSQSGSLKERRALFARSVVRSSDAVRIWEDRAIEEVALRLLSRFWAGAPLPDELPIPHGGLLLTELTTTYLYRDRRFVESQQRRTLISLVDGAAGFQYGTYTPTELFGLEGVTVETKHVRGGTIHTLRFPKKLRRAEQYRFSFRERELSGNTKPPAEDKAGQTFESPTLRYRVEVCFLGDVPSVIWAYDRMSQIERPGEPTQGIPIESVGAVMSVDFADLYGGLASGIAWRW
jgi:hypothetical protein